MGTPPDVTGATAVGVLDLATFNRWLCISRLRAVGGIVVFGVGLHHLAIGGIALPPLFAVCAGLLLTSWIGLCTPGLAARPRFFFYAQTLVDLAAATAGIHAAAHGLAAVLFRPVFAIIIVPASLISVTSGLVVASAAALGHALLLCLDRGLSTATLGSLEMLVPIFVFFLVAQQCFFYGAHLEQKNATLARLAARLESHRHRLAEEHRMSAGLVEVARTLSSTLEAPELLGRVNLMTRQQLGADWSATFLVDSARATFRLVAVTDAGTGSNELGDLELPVHGWPVVARLAHEPVLLLTGADAECLPGLFASNGPLSTVFVAALCREGALVGFLAVGYRVIAVSARERARELLAAIAQHATLALQNARLLEEVRLASAMKSEFVGAISHELRSPLNVMLGYLEMLLDEALGPVSGEQADALVRTRQCTLTLLEMITALLDLNRLEAGRLPVQRLPVDMRALLEELRAQLPDSWRRPEVDLRFVLPPQLPVIETDAGKLRTVVRNLVHNACKFTDRGHVTLSAAATSTGDLTISVRDSGRGIPADAIAYVFDMFRQVPGAGGGGVGLGLHIVRRFVDVLGGQVALTSEVGKGTCFTITLPRVARPGEPPAESGAHSAAAAA
jgi:signal transduction histidine kinase